MQERSLDSGFENGLAINIGDIDKHKSGIDLNPKSNRNGRDLIQVEYVESAEPKSGLLKKKDGLRKVGTILKFDSR